MVQLCFMAISMHSKMVQITFSRQIQTARHCRKNLNRSGNEDRNMIWSSAGEKTRQDGISRVFVTKTLKLVIRICFGVNLTDANTPYRLMKAETMARYIHLIPKDFNLSNVLLAVIYKKKGCSIKFLPVTFRPRQGGVNSINMKKICKIGKQAVIDFVKLNRIIRRT